MSSNVLIRFNNMLLKAEKEKEFWKLLGTCNIVIHKIEYATIYWSCSLGQIKYKQMISVLSIA